MFVKFFESPSMPRGYHIRNGMTVTILSVISSKFYKVMGYDEFAQAQVWDAHVDELQGFDPSTLEDSAA